jgi:hypothetical protein
MRHSEFILVFRTNLKQNLKNWRVLSWKNSFFSQQLQLLLPQCIPQLGGNLHALFLQSQLLRKMNWQLCRLRWHFERVPFLACDITDLFVLLSMHLLVSFI